MVSELASVISSSCPNHINFLSTSRCEIVGDVTTVGCQIVHHQHLGLLTDFCCDVQLLTLVVLPLQWLKIVARRQSWAMWTYHELFGGGPRASERGCQSVGYDHLQCRLMSWMMMARHKSHYGRLIHLHKMHFSFV
jgi:hypothetical protein